MKFSPCFEEAIFADRYKRFFADVELIDGSILTIHCANTGSMTHCLNPGTPCWFSRSSNPRRKLPGTLEIVTTTAGLLAGVNTSRPNHLVAEAIKNGLISELQGYRKLGAEVRYGKENSRIDLLLEDGDSKCYVEVKSVTLEATGGLARFPDAVTTRGRKHLRELARVVADGHRAVLVYCIQLSGVDRMEVAGDIDPDYALAISEAVNAGVEVLAYGCRLSPEEITIDRKVELI
jgi:sugar fermentation stimulation protein A